MPKQSFYKAQALTEALLTGVSASALMDKMTHSPQQFEQVAPTNYTQQEIAEHIAELLGKNRAGDDFASSVSRTATEDEIIDRRAGDLVQYRSTSQSIESSKNHLKFMDTVQMIARVSIMGKLKGFSGERMLINTSDKLVHLALVQRDPICAEKPDIVISSVELSLHDAKKGKAKITEKQASELGAMFIERRDYRDPILLPVSEDAPMQTEKTTTKDRITRGKKTMPQVATA